MSENRRSIKVEFGPFRVVLEGYDAASEGIEMAYQLIRKLSGLKAEADFAGKMPDVTSVAPQAEPRQPAATPDQPTEPNSEESDHPLLLKVSPQSKAADAEGEFQTVRKRVSAPKGNGRDHDPEWLTEIERLEATANKAFESLANGSGADPAHGAQAETMAELESPPAETGPDADQLAEDGFSPRSIANADTHPAEQESFPDLGGDTAENFEFAADGAAAVEEVAEDTADPVRLDASSRISDTAPVSDDTELNRQGESAQPETQEADAEKSRDYLAMEEKAIDRLLETTNALLKTDDHTRKNRSLNRMKAAVVATEAERRIRVKTAHGTVTLDFDEKDHPESSVAHLLSTPIMDPEKRTKQLQAYRKAIAEHKKRS
jgi:hypothetical protein